MSFALSRISVGKNVMILIHNSKIYGMFILPFHEAPGGAARIDNLKDVLLPVLSRLWCRDTFLYNISSPV